MGWSRRPEGFNLRASCWGRFNFGLNPASEKDGVCVCVKERGGTPERGILGGSQWLEGAGESV